MTNLEYIAANLSEEDILCQIAEEAAELSKAALKLRRVLTGTNPTPVSYEDAIYNLIEEYGDVVGACVVYFMKHDLIDRKYVDVLEHSNPKYSRWAQRIKESKKHE